MILTNNGKDRRSHSRTSKRFGLGYEKKSLQSPSVQHARAEFLLGIVENRPQCVLELFTHCFPHFEAFLSRNEAEITSITESLEASIPPAAYVLRQAHYLREGAVERLIPNWHSLANCDGAKPLLEALKQWGNQQNLVDEWCFDDAMEVLRAFYCDENKQLAFSLPDNHLVNHLFRQAWEAAARQRRLLALHKQFELNQTLEARGDFLFSFRYEGLFFEIPGPFNRFWPEFENEVEARFKAVGGSAVRGARTALDLQLKTYRDRVKEIVQSYDLVKPPRTWASTEHLRWLIIYQLSPCWSYRAIANRYQKDSATVREGIQAAANLIRLTLRPSSRGRPPGITELTSRRRAKPLPN